MLNSIKLLHCDPVCKERVQGALEVVVIRVAVVAAPAPAARLDMDVEGGPVGLEGHRRPEAEHHAPLEGKAEEGEKDHPG